MLKGVVGKDALFCTLTDKIDAEVIEKAGPKLKVIATMSVGYEHIDLIECKKRKIRVGYTPEVLTDAVADLTIALLLSVTRRLIEASNDVHNGGWKSWAPMYMCGPAIKDTTIGKSAAFSKYSFYERAFNFTIFRIMKTSLYYTI